MKKKLLLETVLQIKATVEKSIASSYEDIIKYNFTEKKVDSLLERIEKLEVQLIHLKEVIQEANKGKMGGKTNNFNIYFLSNLKAKYKFYETLIQRTERRKTGTPQISLEVSQSRFNKLGEEINKFQDKLSAFNAKKKVTVYLDESLNLL